MPPGLPFLQSLAVEVHDHVVFAAEQDPCADVVEARRACGHAGPYRSAEGRLVGQRDDAARRWGCAEKLQRERLAVATASRSPPASTGWTENRISSTRRWASRVW